jgi:hypothetical protein
MSNAADALRIRQGLRLEHGRKKEERRVWMRKRRRGWVGDAAEKYRILNTPPGGCLFFFDISHSLDM